MLLKVAKSSVLLVLAASALHANAFTEQAEMDRKAIIKYFEDKFEDGEKNKDRFFPYSTDTELKGFVKGVKHNDFNIGSYAYNQSAKDQYLTFKDGMMPFEDAVEKGAQLYKKPFANGKSLADCFPDPTVSNEYPKFDETKKAVVSLTVAVNNCLTENGEKPWNTKKDDMASFQGFLGTKAAEAGKVVDVQINSKEAQDAYERGKKYYYSQRGYLKMSCATCHVQGAGQRVRNESMSPLLGQMTHWPVFRLKWDSLGTAERRMSGCIVDQGQKPPKDDSKQMQEMLYFMGYMSNGMKIDGPDLRK
ncbi:MAG: sulfur oxidation c-type cytochrome SoxA [Arcobacteraceae bacterium]|nr:sulfur oxidation c-type cytochrome SoxA [Arcobacteraceae bacterium]